MVRSQTRRRGRASLVLLVGLALAGPVELACTKGEDGASTDALELIPADIQGIYGRDVSDEPGMVVTAAGLEYGEMKLTIHAGKMEGSTVRVERATLQWKKVDPKTCSGTISRQGDRLLMTLYDDGHPEAKCESVLDAEWFRWEALDQLPDLVQGRYGNLLVEPGRMRLDIEWAHEELATKTIRALPGTNDERAELLIAAAKVEREDPDGATHEFQCSGKLSFEDGQLRTDFWVPAQLVPAVGSEEAEDPARQEALRINEEACDNWDGGATKWEVSLANLPKQTVAYGDLSLAISAEQVVLDSPDLRCEQALWRTESVDAQARWGRSQVGGERMTLAKAAPTRVSEDCKLKLRIWCELQEGGSVAELDPAVPPAEHVAACMDFTEHGLCPESITVRAISDLRHKVHVEPASFMAIACVDPTGEFTAAAAP